MTVSRLIGIACALFLTACQGVERKDTDTLVKGRAFQAGDLVKADIDLVTETNIRLSMDYLEQLAYKLYRRNPRQLRRGGWRDARQSVAVIFSADRTQELVSLQNKSSVDAIRLAFDPAFQGDRVFAFIEGLRSMIVKAYGDKQSFHMLDQLDPQKLYYSARNIEIAVWKLGQDRDLDGQLFLLSNSVQPGVANLSFERLFGKLIALQDSMAQISADATSRSIKNVIQGVASVVFFPI